MLKHNMGKPWLETVLATLASSKIPLPQSRDSAGSTIMSQLRQAGIAKATIGISLLDTIEKAGVGQLARRTQISTVLPNYGDQVSITNFEDMCLYDHHRALVQTIIKADSFPRHEDDDGRNGLHCLAEVSLSLPIIGHISNYAVDHDGFETRREGLMYGLIRPELTSTITTSRALLLLWLSLHIYERARTAKVPNGFFTDYSKLEPVSIVGITLEHHLCT